MQEPILVVDAGNILFKEQATLPSENQQIQQIKAETIAAAYGLMRFDAIGVSGSDLQAGESFFRAPEIARLPWLSANIIDGKGKLFFRPHLLREVHGERIAIIGLTDNAPPGTGLQIFDWRKALENELTNLKDQASFIVILSSLPSTDNDQLCKQFPQVRLVLSAVPHRANMPARTINNALITQTGPQGKYLGHLSITFRNHHSWNQVGENETEILKQKIKSLDQQILILTKSTPDHQSEQEARKLARLQMHRENVAEQLELIQKSSEDNKRATGDIFSTFFQQIHPETSVAPVTQLLDKMHQRIEKLQENTTGAMHDTRAAKVLNDGIAGNQSCTSCHPVQAAFWQTTRHAKAFSSLVQKGRDKDPACLPCHVTIVRSHDSSPVQDRLDLAQLPAERQNVGCEDCHYPAELHLASPQQVHPTRRPTKQWCQDCHTKEQDPEFNYLDKINIIRCPPAWAPEPRRPN